MIRLTHFFIIALVFFALRTQGQETTDAVSNPAAEQAGRSSEQLEAVVKPNKKVLLRWDVFFFNQTDSSYCTIERSINGKDFDVISIIKDQHADGRPEFVDEMPARGTNYYRVRFSSPGKADRFSPVAKAAVNADFAVKILSQPGRQDFDRTIRQGNRSSTDGCQRKSLGQSITWKRNAIVGCVATGKGVVHHYADAKRNGSGVNRQTRQELISV